MVYNLPAAPNAVDYDLDGFMDTVYIGDVGGNMWRFKFCLASEDTTLSPCTYSKWSGSLLLNNH
jgi:Tfp pilus tip-associated adhesin PilY1